MPRVENKIKIGISNLFSFKSSKKLTEKDVVGSYQSEGENQRLVIRENGGLLFETIDVVKEEIHIIGNYVKIFMRVKYNGDLIKIAEVNGFGKRYDYPKSGIHETFKKIK